MANMVTEITVDKDYKVIKRKVINEKPMPNKILDLIAPIIRRGLEK